MASNLNTQVVIEGPDGSRRTIQFDSDKTWRRVGVKPKVTRSRAEMEECGQPMVLAVPKPTYCPHCGKRLEG